MLQAARLGDARHRLALRESGCGPAAKLATSPSATSSRVGCAADTIQRIDAGTRRPSKQVAALQAARLANPPPGRCAFAEFAHLSRFPAGLDPHLLGWI